MQPDSLTPVPRGLLKQHLLRSLGQYWPRKEEVLDRLPVVEMGFPEITGSLQLVEVTLPEWAKQWGVDGSLVVPIECCMNPSQPTRKKVDWWLAAFLLLECWHERIREQKFGVIHSYSFRLQDWDERVWERAWVNRIALFLREWEATVARQDTTTLFGSLPQAEIRMTHDVDAINKTWSIRIKQSAFLGFNALRLFAKGQAKPAIQRVSQAFRFLFGSSNWFVFSELMDIEKQAGIRSHFNFYADTRIKTLKRWLLDPGYNIDDPNLHRLFENLVKGGWIIGLHQSYDAWKSADLMRTQRTRLQSLVNVAVSTCRQHWLRFSWRDTWAAQAAAGFQCDMTLMFNDRPGFRAAAALNWIPWDHEESHPHQLSIMPTILMDSHFYDYETMSDTKRRSALRYWLNEVVAVRGQAA
ncbi:MAG TPA: hypothetical protein EYP34_07625, partial [Chromatiaceae bacterium]|nr:hypothetical protein [Chromatiaceae bacterium]